MLAHRSRPAQRIAPRLAGLLTAAALAGCGPGSLVGGDAANGDAASGDVASGEQHAAITLEQVRRPDGIGAVVAMQRVASDAATPAGCTRADLGACRVLRCNGAQRSALSVGSITLAVPPGGRAQPLILVPVSETNPTLPSRPDGYWTPGSLVDLMTSGGEVPAFSASLSMPGLAVSEPASAPTAIDRAADFTVRWSAPNASQVLVSLAQAGADGAQLELACAFAAGDGSGAVPARVLGELAAGSEATLRIAARGAGATVVAGAFRVALEARWVERDGVVAVR